MYSKEYLKDVEDGFWNPTARITSNECKTKTVRGRKIPAVHRFILSWIVDGFRYKEDINYDVEADSLDIGFACPVYRGDKSGKLSSRFAELLRDYNIRDIGYDAIELKSKLDEAIADTNTVIHKFVYMNVKHHVILRNATERFYMHNETPVSNCESQSSASIKIPNVAGKWALADASFAAYKDSSGSIKVNVNLTLSIYGYRNYTYREVYEIADGKLQLSEYV